MKLDPNFDLKSLFVVLLITSTMGFSNLAWSDRDKNLILSGKEESEIDIKKEKSPVRNELRGEEIGTDDKGDNKFKKKAVRKAGAAAVSGVAVKKIISNITED